MNECFWTGFEGSLDKHAGVIQALGRGVGHASQAAGRASSAIRALPGRVAQGAGKLVQRVKQAPTNMKAEFQLGQAQAAGKSIGQFHFSRAKAQGVPIQKYKAQNAGVIEAGQAAQARQVAAAKQKALAQRQAAQAQVAAKEKAKQQAAATVKPGTAAPAGAAPSQAAKASLLRRAAVPAVAAGTGLAGGAYLASGSSEPQGPYGWQ